MPTLIPSSDEVRIYEVAIMIQPDLDQKSELTLLKEIDAHFAEATAKLLFKDVWTKRGLAYKIGGYHEAKFVIFYLEMPPASIRELDKQLRLTKGVLRHLVVIPPAGYEAISYEEHYQNWLKNRETESDIRARKREEKLKEKTIVQAKRAAKQRIAPKPKTADIEMADLSAELEKMISDEDLKI